MQWVIHGSLTKTVGEALTRFGHAVHTFDELELPKEPTPREIVWTANKKQWDLITNDSELIQWIYEDRFPFRRSIVFLQLAGGEAEQDEAINRLFARYKRLAPCRLYTVTGSRVKIRQLPAGRVRSESETRPDSED